MRTLSRQSCILGALLFVVGCGEDVGIAPGTGTGNSQAAGGSDPGSTGKNTGKTSKGGSSNSGQKTGAGGSDKPTSEAAGGRAESDGGSSGDATGGRDGQGGSSSVAKGGSQAVATTKGGSTSGTGGKVSGTGGAKVGTGGSTSATGGKVSGTGGAKVGTGGSTARTFPPFGSGGVAPTGGAASGGAASGGKVGTGGSATGGGASTSTGTVDCNATMPTGGTLHSGNGQGGKDNLAWQIWSNVGSGNLTTFSTPAFIASWNNSGDYLGRLGYEWGNAGKAYTAYGTIGIDYVFKKTGTGGPYSYIGVYGWSVNPCIEWYIVEDSFSAMPFNTGDPVVGTADIDGGTYNLVYRNTSGTGGNRCGNVSRWDQFYSIRKKGSQCGHISVTEHFKAWETKGWKLGNLLEVKILVEAGGGSGSVEFPIANVTTSN